MGDFLTRAPGKAMIFGEYAVLEGAPAVVAAVDRYVAVRRDPAAPPSDSPFVRTACAAAGQSPTGLHIDSSALYAGGDGGRKLGFGSSAAVTVAVYQANRPAAPKETTYAACKAAHDEAQGQVGSGADLAAAIWGGVLRFQPTAMDPTITPIDPAGGLDLLLVDTGEPASTGDRIAAWRRIARDRSQEARPIRTALTALAQAFATADHAADWIDLARRWNEPLAALEALTDLPILTLAHRRIAAIAQPLGAAAKPSGAGGGDLAICFVPPSETQELRRRLTAAGFPPLPLQIGAPGVHRIPLDTEMAS